LPAMEAAQALADLTEISAQIAAAVLAEPGGAVVASTFSEDDKGKAFAAAAAELVRIAGDSGELSSKELVQVQAASPQGCVFVVRDERHLVAAVTGAQPTVGLVFYDLKSCLRLLEREKTETKPKTVRRPRVKKEADAGS
jgi:predicted regulator of Ras-like GTPase activity (Roadblock/LC7/MglB family)